MLNLPKLIGHRGVKDLSPENTIDSISLAKKLGLNWIEIDIKISKDLVPIAFHDDLLDRTTNGRGLVVDYCYGDLKKLDAGIFFYNQPTKIYIPLFKEILILSQNKNINLNIELKPNKGFEKENVQSIAKILNNFKFSSKYYFSSFDLNSLIMMKKIIPNANYGFLVDVFTKEINLNEIIKISKKYGFFSCGFNKNLVNSDVIDITLSNNLILTIFSDKNIRLEEAKELWNKGVTSIFVDNPKEFNII